MNNLIEGWRGRWKTESKDDPLDRLPKDLTEKMIYGNPEEASDAFRRLQAWSRLNETPVFPSESEFIADARAQVGFDSEFGVGKKVANDRK